MLYRGNRYGDAEPNVKLTNDERLLAVKERLKNFPDTSKVTMLLVLLLVLLRAQLVLLLLVLTRLPCSSKWVGHEAEAKIAAALIAAENAPTILPKKKQCQIQQDIDFVGNDLSNSDQASLLACCGACAEAKGCHAWTVRFMNCDLLLS